MISSELGVVAMVAALLAFAWLGVRAARRGQDLEEFVVARNSQRSLALGLSFLASGMGAWILFAPPEVGAFVGLVGVIGYALAAAAPIAVFALLGRLMRRYAPRGRSLTEFIRVRFGRPFQLYIISVSLAYMFIFVTAELTAIGAVAAILSGAEARIAIVLVAAVTFGYTAYGGLRASIRTDYWQGWLVVALLLIGAGAVLIDLADPDTAFTDSGLIGMDRGGIEVAVTLIIAVTAANMFHQGYWQRVWSAESDNALAKGAVIGIVATIPVMLVIGVLGIMAAGSGVDLGDPPVPFFALATRLPDWTILLVLLLGTALVASSVDTLQSGLTALVAAENRRMSLLLARGVTLLLLVPAVVIAWQGYSVLRLFLIADLLCAATVVPALLGLWGRATVRGAFAGSIAGLAGALAINLVDTGSLNEAVRLATFPGAIPTLEPFLGAVLASTVVAVALAMIEGRSTDLEAMAEQSVGITN
jgi:solute:Na+ symporter, SSS family